MRRIIKDVRDNPNVAIVSALISAIAMIVVALIGLVPELKSRGEMIDILESKLASLGFEQPYTSERWHVAGTVSADSLSQNPIRNAEIYLVRAEEMEFAIPDDEGRFVFADMFPGVYWIVIRNNESECKYSGRGLIDTSRTQTDVFGAHIKYTITKTEDE